MDRTKFQSIATCALAAALLSSPAQPQSAAQTVTAWTNGRWFNGTMFTPLDVYSVGPRLTLKRPRRIDRTVDLANTYVTPAFGEAHNHNLPGGDADAMIRTYLSQGIFYVMIQENSPDARAQLADRINRPTSVDVAFANGAFTSPGGHPSALVERNIKNGGMRDADRDGGFLHPVSSTDNIDRQWWTRIRQQRPDFVKMMLVYSEDRATGVPRPTDTDRHGLDPTLAAHLVKLARREKLRVSAHVESAYDFEVAVNAGADIIAHMPGFWPDVRRMTSQGIGIYRITDEVAARAGRRRATPLPDGCASLERASSATAQPLGDGSPTAWRRAYPLPMAEQWDLLFTLPNLSPPIPTPFESSGYVICSGDDPRLKNLAANAGNASSLQMRPEHECPS